MVTVVLKNHGLNQSNDVSRQEKEGLSSWHGNPVAKLISIYIDVRSTGVSCGRDLIRDITMDIVDINVPTLTF